MDTRILIVEDDERLANLIRQYLEKNHFQVACYFTGEDAIPFVLAHQPDLLILDLMLPGQSGFDICRALRSSVSIPIVILTANDSETDEIIGLELGADDYVSKSTDPRLLLARIRAVLRRQSSVEDSEKNTDGQLKFGELILDQHTQSAMLAKDLLDLTTAEFDLLWLLANHAGTILSRDYILGHLRGIEFDGFDRSIDFRISRIRRKLNDDPDSPRWIKTIRGKGYLFIQ